MKLAQRGEDAPWAVPSLLFSGSSEGRQKTGASWLLFAKMNHPGNPVPFSEPAFLLQGTEIQRRTSGQHSKLLEAEVQSILWVLFVKGEALFTRKSLHPPDKSFLQLGTEGSIRWVCTLHGESWAISSKGSGIVSRVPGLRGGFPFECKTDCALASPYPVPLGQQVVARRVDACSRSRCLVGLLFGLGYFCLLLCNWGEQS